MLLVLLHRLPEDALGELGLADEFDFADPDLGTLVDLEEDVDFVLAFFGRLDLDFGRVEAFFGQQVFDGLLDLLDLGGIV